MMIIYFFIKEGKEAATEERNDRLEKFIIEKRGKENRFSGVTNSSVFRSGRMPLLVTASYFSVSLEKR